MGILHQLRATVSADKHRFVYGDIDIDFTYITDRIIGLYNFTMSLTCQQCPTLRRVWRYFIQHSASLLTSKSAYRNDINDVSFVLHDRHKDKFLVYNLTERHYDYSKFGGSVCF
jgi:hypothetical protein